MRYILVSSLIGYSFIYRTMCRPLFLIIRLVSLLHVVDVRNMLWHSEVGRRMAFLSFSGWVTKIPQLLQSVLNVKLCGRNLYRCGISATCCSSLCHSPDGERYTIMGVKDCKKLLLQIFDIRHKHSTIVNWGKRTKTRKLSTFYYIGIWSKSLTEYSRSVCSFVSLIHERKCVC